MSLLEIRGITKRFGGVIAVNDVCMHIDHGEIVSLIGPNGAGKTTVFNMLTGVYGVDEGEIRFDGKTISNCKPKDIVKAGIARTFQNLRLFKDMRVIENIMIGDFINTKYSFLDILFRTKKFKEYELISTQKAVDILYSIGLEQYINDYAGNLPYGAQRRLEIARALATDPQLLLLDEPAAGMNGAETEDLLQFIVALRNKGFTILLIEHDMNLVMNISDRIYVLDHGVLIKEGIPEEVATDPVVIEAYLGRSDDL